MYVTIIMASLLDVYVAKMYEFAVGDIGHLVICICPIVQLQ